MVNFLSNQYSIEITTVQRRQNEEDQKSEKVIPKATQDYTEGGMSHVNTYDATLSRFQHYKNMS